MANTVADAVRKLCGVNEDALYASFAGSRRALVRALLAQGFTQPEIDATLRRLADAEVLKLHTSHLKWNEPKWQTYNRKAQMLAAV